MSSFYQDILDQPHALRTLVQNYRSQDLLVQTISDRVDRAPLLTGMGASYHAAWIAGLHFNALGIPAKAIEATDLLLAPLLQRRDMPLVYLSQSGYSAEVAPLLAQKPPYIIAITNDATSLLARSAHINLPIHAGLEEFVATKTYVNSLALVWLLVRVWNGQLTRDSFDLLEVLADRAERLVQAADVVAERWLEILQDSSPLIFLGVGPHAATARQAAMMVAEWVKAPALSFSNGAFRHGFIESVERGTGVVLFASQDAGYAATEALAQELAGYGARVLMVSYGQSYLPGETRPFAQATSEFLAPILDIIPAQLFAEALARVRKVPAGFRYIGKVISKV